MSTRVYIFIFETILAGLTWRYFNYRKQYYSEIWTIFVSFSIYIFMSILTFNMISSFLRTDGGD